MDYEKICNEMLNALRDWQEEDSISETTRLKISSIRRIYFNEEHKNKFIGFVEQCKTS